MFNVSNLLFSVHGSLGLSCCRPLVSSTPMIPSTCRIGEWVWGGVKAYGLTGVGGGSATVGLGCGLWPVGWCYFKGTTGWSTLLILGSLRLGVLGLGHRELCLLGPI